ncbi:hypothetical protein [Halobacteriovorax sp.]|uniref:hypothetical protein n=1 Tax=Halobacteriovorax sp. TaxID=2020862 RepID=UPI003568F3AD
MIRFNKNQFSILCILLAFVSCGQNHSGNDRGLASVGEEFGIEIKLLDANSETIALRICNALRSKRSYWHSTPIIGKKANISVEGKNCSQENEQFDLETTISSTLMSNPIILDSLSNQTYYKEVLTESHGALSTVCPSIFAGDNPLEFYTQGSDRVYTQFAKIDSNSDRLTIKYAETNSNDQQEVSGYKVYKHVTYDIITSSTDATFLGTVSEISMVEACGEESFNRTRVQKLNSIL